MAQIESILDLKLEVFGETLRAQLMDTFCEQLSGIAMGKGKTPTETPVVHTTSGSSSSIGIGPNRDRNKQGIRRPCMLLACRNVTGMR